MNENILASMRNPSTELYPDEWNAHRVAAGAGVELPRLAFHDVAQNSFSTRQTNEPKIENAHNGSNRATQAQNSDPMVQEEINWSFLVKQIKSKKCIPFISNRVSNQYLFGGEVAADWAKSIEYPLADSGKLPRVAQFKSIETESESETKFAYLEFLKEKLLANAERKMGNRPFLHSIRQELADLTFTELADKLGYCNFANQPDNVWSILAQLSLPLYITTSYHGLLEKAITTLHPERQPYSGIYCWGDLLQDSHSEFIPNVNLDPTDKQPLVYHIHGIDANADSLVLTEDNYFEFLENIASDFNQPESTNRCGIPRFVRTRLAQPSYSLLLLGYNLYDWEFRMAFRSAIESQKVLRRSLSLFIQFEPGTECDPTMQVDKAKIYAYLTKYAKRYGFKIYLGDAASFTNQLWQEFNQ